jgi:hypothetical protein
LGCPEGEELPVYLAEQAFENGLMLWDSETIKIHVLLYGAIGGAGSWATYDDTFVEGVDPPWDPNLPPPPQQPQRGFGKVWREQLGGAESQIGWALEVERGLDGWHQSFDSGLLVWTDSIPQGSAQPGIAYVLFDDGMWTSFSSPAE